MTHHDLTLIDRLSGIVADSPIDRAFRARPAARENAEASYRLLLHPETPGAVSLVERRAVAAFVAILTGEEQTRAHFLALLRQTDAEGARLAPLIEAEAEGAARPGPYGRFPPGPLSGDDLDGPTYRLDPALRPAFGARLSAALEHAHLLTLHPRDASADALQALLAAGWTTTGVVTLSQLVAFLGFQIRVVTGLRSYVAARQPHTVSAK